MGGMTRHTFGGLTTPPPTPPDPRDALNHLAAGFDAHFGPGTLRSVLADAADIPGDEWQEIRAAIEAAMAAAEHPRPEPRREPLGELVPEGVRFQVYASVDADEPLGEVVTGPGGSFDASAFVHLATASSSLELFLRPVPDTPAT